MKSLTKYQIPFELSTGHQIREKLWHHNDTNMIERDNVPFTDTLRYVSYDESYRSNSVHVTMKRTDGSNVFMFFADFSKLLKILRDGEVTGEWAFIKRGPKFGCYLINHIP